MTSERDQIRALAERVARRLSSPGGSEDVRYDAAPGDLTALRAGFDEIQRRLAHVESHIKHDDSCEDTSSGATGRPAQGARESITNRRPEEEGGGRVTTPARSLWLSGTYVPATEHPSEERFGIGEAVSEMVDYFEREKTCQMEPGGKPCDHCAMCSSRGF